VAVLQPSKLATSVRSRHGAPILNRRHDVTVACEACTFDVWVRFLLAAPFYNPVPIFICMRIALTRGNHIVSRLIRRFTRGQYSHAAMILKDDSVIESVSKGVCKFPKLQLGKNETANIYWVETTKEQEKIIEEFLHKQVGKKFDNWMIFGFILFTGKERRKSRKRWFCSELVFAAFEKAGINLLERTEPWLISPTMLSYSPKLKYLYSE